MTIEQIHELKERQRQFFLSGATLDVNFRLAALNKLYAAMEKYSDKLLAALKSDLGKSGFEADMCEVRLTMSEISFMKKHVRRYSRNRHVVTNLANFHSSSFRLPSPYGNVLIMSPWNYPVLLTLEPLADAIAAGNTVLLKPSAYSPATTAAISEMIAETFAPSFVAVIQGGRAENQALLNERFDYIFFTGSKAVGKEVMKAASAFLTPVTLELGGKSPVVVDESADIKLAARRIVFGKYLNLGQTCVAPDYILVDNKVRSIFVAYICDEIRRQFGSDAFANDNYGKIISQKHYDRVRSLIDPKKVVYGGRCDDKSLRIEPTVMDNVTMEDPVMQQEIFGPIMPIIGYDTLDQAVAMIETLEHPLAFYVFSSSKKNQRCLTRRIGFGGGCINDVIIHLATSNMGFGGFGESGMGSYHGKQGFETFSHFKSIVDKKTWLDLPMRYQPYSNFMHKVIKLFLR